MVPRWPLIALELLLLAVLVWLNPLRLTNPRDSASTPPGCCSPPSPSTTRCRRCLLDIRILSGEVSNKAAVLLGSGGAIFVTNIIVFGIWYWELDRGGPFARRAGAQPYPDFMFPQMDPDTANCVKPGWRPDVRRLPLRQPHQRDGILSHRHHAAGPLGEGMMAVQSLVAVTTMALVIARAVNVLG